MCILHETYYVMSASRLRFQQKKKHSASCTLYTITIFNAISISIVHKLVCMCFSHLIIQLHTVSILISLLVVASCHCHNFLLFSHSFDFRHLLLLLFFYLSNHCTNVNKTRKRKVRMPHSVKIKWVESLVVLNPEIFCESCFYWHLNGKPIHRHV